MCGIFGVINFNGSPVDRDAVERSTDMMTLRGPDERGIYVEGPVGLGHRRLSIVDIAGGKQPMCTGDRSAFIVFNGEIYNHREIRKAVGEGAFTTHSDTEAILLGYKKYGTRIVDMLDGDFAFAIWDATEKKIFIARDRLGVKPLYYYRDGLRFIFASNPKPIQTFSGVSGIEPDFMTLFYYLSYYKHNLNTDTVYKNIHILEKGTFATIDLADGGIKITRYWDPKTFFHTEESEKHDDKFYIDNIRMYFEKAVEKRLMGDVPLGAYLSGGVDSSAIVAVMAEKIPRVKTYSIGFADKGFNEFEYIDKVVDRFGTDHHTILMTEDRFFSRYDELMAITGLPMSVPNQVAIYEVSRELKKDFTVAISGEGSDELFAGYGVVSLAPYDFERYHNPEKFGLNSHSTRYLFENYIHPSLFADKIAFVRGSYSWLPESELAGIVRDQEAFLPHANAMDNFFATHFSNNINRFKDEMQLFLENIHLEGLILRLDLASMAASVEGRVPFTDHHLVEFGLGIPFEQKWKWRSEELRKMADFIPVSTLNEEAIISKYLLKQAFRDRIPAEIVERKKYSFPCPVETWFAGSRHEYLKERIMSSERLFDIFDRDKMTHFISKRAVDNYGLKMWMLFNAAVWLEKNF